MKAKERKMTEIFYGEAGTGKTAAMFERIKELASKGEQCMLFVPEQFSFDTERAAYFAVGAENARFVKVTGFSKLARKILEKYKKARPCADDAVKLITMWKAVEKSRADFLSLNKEKNSSGLCRLMLKTVAAFRNGGVSPAQLRRSLEEQEGMDEGTADKSEDFLRIYEEYDKSLTQSLDDKLDDLSRAAALAEEYGYFKGLHLFFDDFDSFSAVQRRLLSAAVPQAESALFCLTCDSPKSRRAEFICVSKTAAEIAMLSPEVNYRRFSVPYREKGRDNTPVRLFSAKTPYEEAELIAAMIHHAVREEKLRYRDILILVSRQEYEPILLSRLKKSGIPVFCDLPHPMTDKPVIGFVLQLLSALSFEGEELLSLAESGFKRVDGKLLPLNKAYMLRNAASAYELTPSRWQSGWSSDPCAELRPLEPIRKGVVEPLVKLKEKLLAAKDGAEFSAVFMEYLLDTEDIRSTFLGRSKAGEGGETDFLATDAQAGEEYSRIWDALSEAVSSIAYCLEGTKTSIEQYRSILEEILSGVNLANPPAVLDSVTVGDIERTRKASAKIVFIAGFNEGDVPRATSLQSVFTREEREALVCAGLPVYDSDLVRWSKERYFAYRAMNLHGKRLILTFCRQDGGGNGKSPAKLPQAENIEPVRAEDIPTEYFLNTRDDLKTLLARVSGKDKELALEIEQILQEQYFSDGIKNAAELLSGKRELRISKASAEKLFGGAVYSPTRLEAAFSCPFLYFCRYGLKLREPSDNDPASPANIGSAVHLIMRLALEKGVNVGEMRDEELGLLASEAAGEAAEQMIHNDPSCPERTRAIYLSLVPAVYRMLRQARPSVKAGGFVPSAFEKQVSYVIKSNELPDGELKIAGTADRIDRLSADEGDYVMIYDYKTGKTVFSPNGAENGFNLQMLLYLFAECENAFPAGVGYIRAGEGTPIRTDSTVPVSLQEQTANEYEKQYISGAIFNSPRVLEAFDGTQEAIRKETGADSRKKYGSIYTLDAGKFLKFRSHIEQNIIVPKVRSLLDGDIRALPLPNEKKLPCEYCPFKAQCGNGGKNAAELSREELEEFVV